MNATAAFSQKLCVIKKNEKYVVIDTPSMNESKQTLHFNKSNPLAN